MNNVQKSENFKEKVKEQQKKTKEATKKTINEYKNFAIKGNVIDMAIGVVIGSAFTSIVNTLVSAVITPLISVLTNKIDLSTLFITIHGPKLDTIEASKAAGAITINYGEVINAILNFFIISVTLFIVIMIIKKLNKKEEVVKEITTKECPYCLSRIPIKATKCAYCTSDLSAKSRKGYKLKKEEK